MSDMLYMNVNTCNLDVLEHLQTTVSCLRHFDLVNSISPEYMHMTLLGVSKSVLKFWLKVSVTLHTNLNEVEDRIKQNEVPSEICREPRALADVKHWKGATILYFDFAVILDMFFNFCVASEYRAWILFYALPVLSGILEADYYQHFALVAVALWLLLQSTVSLEDIDKAESLIQEICSQFSVLYGKMYCMDGIMVRKCVCLAYMINK